ncbi:hypothetical protein [Mycolicibacterium nivoides]|uniref:Uncharacterized protein n=1 Tax=Mycolicibacterium nivoides TaxID=2487344 RepID=A0ABW9LBJ5_9MYCO
MGLLLYELGFLDYRGVGDERDRMRKNRRDGRQHRCRLLADNLEKLCISASLTSGFADFANPWPPPAFAPTIGACRS